MSLVSPHESINVVKKLPGSYFLFTLHYLHYLHYVTLGVPDVHFSTEHGQRVSLGPEASLVGHVGDEGELAVGVGELKAARLGQGARLRLGTGGEDARVFDGDVVGRLDAGERNEGNLLKGTEVLVRTSNECPWALELC